MAYPLYIFFGVIPSLVWLLFYLRKDSHPEPHSQILKVFFYGVLIAVPALLMEMGALQLLHSLSLSKTASSILYIFLGVALLEEFLKYLVVNQKIFRNKELDEPVDIMIYMIVSALGFAAAENILFLFSLGPNFLLGETILVTIFRFVGATFLHALVSALFGYFLALSFCTPKKQIRYFTFGLIVSTILHGCYNFFIIKTDGLVTILAPSVILLGLVVFFILSLKDLKQMKSICKI